jgi:glycosyltransferase involved in cell wall biosynthesis
MRVAMLSRDYPPTTGGIPTHARAIVEGVRKTGVEVDVFEGRSDLGTLFLPYRKRKTLAGYDLVHIQGSPYAAFDSKHPLVLTVHSPLVEEGKYYPLGNKAKVPVGKLFERRSFKRADAIIAISASTEQCLVERYGVPAGKIVRIPNGVDLERFKPLPKPEVPRILVCARLDKRKNIPETIEALAHLQEYAFDFAIVGDGPERGSLEALAERVLPRTKFLGAVADDDLSRMYGEANIFVTTSRSEGFGLTVVEAMASGCAVVVSDIPTHREIVADGSDALVYTGLDDLIEKVRLLLTSPEKRSALGKAARISSLAFSWDAVVSKTLDVYKDVLSRKIP